MKIKNTRICSEMILLSICTILLSTNPVFSATLFSDDFESGLAKWSTIGSGVIVSDPLEPSNHALSFTGFSSAGDIFSRQIVNATGSYILSFDYLGTCSGNCGGFIGYDPNDVWLGGTDYSGYPALLKLLLDTGHWERVTIVFSGPTTLSLKLEDWFGSGGVPGDAYFDNILLTDENGPSTSFNLFLPLVLKEFFNRNCPGGPGVPPTLNWVTLSPNSAPTNNTTQVNAQFSFSDPDGDLDNGTFNYVATSGKR